jgi:CDP-diglyceride synthetase
MDPVFVIFWLIAMVTVVALRRYWMRRNNIGYLYASYGLAAVFIAVLVALVPHGAMYALAVIAAVGLPIGLLVDRRRHISET